MREHLLVDIEKCFWEQWQEIERVHMLYVDQSPIGVFTDFVMQNYFDIIASVVKEIEDYPMPKVDVTIGASSPEYLKKIETMGTDGWRHETLKVPLTMQGKRPEEPPQKFWDEHYYNLYSQGMIAGR